MLRLKPERLEKHVGEDALAGGAEHVAEIARRPYDFDSLHGRCPDASLRLE
jgi:hypothetical protein